MEIQGFKSFANKTIINFDSNIVGIVGPNGCGKSNINDAIRWVLGEQSVKSLRGTSMSDVIFAGSSGKTAVNMAQVTLVFDNEKRHLPIDYNEVEITRRIYRMNNENEYFLNKVPCRLKDITNLILDSGLGRDSLSVISQGNISSFAESKPEDRRAIFEEAAGVSKYKKRKLESLSKLERTQENLLRIEDIMGELGSQIKPLKSAAEKAKLYLSKKSELEKVEITVLVDEIEQIQSETKRADETLFTLETKLAATSSEILLTEQTTDELRTKINHEDQAIAALQSQFMEIVSDISQLETRKVELDEKRKYQLETADVASKAQTLKLMVEEAKLDYDNREERLKHLKANDEMYKLRIEDEKKHLHQIQEQLSKAYREQQELKNRETVLENLIAQPYQSQHAVKTILEAKMDGVFGTVSQLVTPTIGYEQAISSSFGGSMYHLVCDDAETARKAIEYLKKNRSGRATFLPLRVIKQNNVSDDILTIAKSVEGFLGVAKDFVCIDKRYESLIAHLLGNILVVSDLKAGNVLADLLKRNYKIITLDGDAINKGGSMTGGSQKHNNSPLTHKSELVHVQAKIKEYGQKIYDLYEIEKPLKEKLEDRINTRYQTQLDIAEITPIVDVKKSKYNDLLAQLETLKPYLDEEHSISLDDTLLNELNEKIIQRDETNSKIKTKRKHRFEMNENLMMLNEKLSVLRKEERTYNEKKNELQIQIAKQNTRLDFLAERLSKTYEMTFEFASKMKVDLDLEIARKEVVRLRFEIQKLGNINLDAPLQYEELKERYERLETNVNELKAARDTILKAIEEMDETMSKQFTDMFHKINNELDQVFKALFGGGKASLKMVDPTDVLHTGIDIDVQPPGKSISNIRLFSGGEKALIAISVLFAILRARTVPLCIFDEVEAALDQANVERFAKYIANFAGDSQFIVVTHRPGTMAQCETLFGVTMQQNGVSEILRVKLSEAIDIVDEGESLVDTTL